MFGLGPAEVILVLLIALIVFGPGRLPEIGQAMGKSIREFRDATSGITDEINRELQATEQAARVESKSKKASATSGTTGETSRDEDKSNTAENEEKPADDSA